DPGLGPAAKLPFHPGFSLLEGLLGGIRHVGPRPMWPIIGGLAMPGRGEGLPVARQLRGNLLWRGAGSKRSGAEGVAPFRNLFSRPRRGSRYPDRRSGLLHGPRQQGEVLIVVKFALIRKALLGPGRADNIEALPETLPGRFHGDIKPGKLVRLVAPARAEAHPPVANQLKLGPIF